MTKEKKIRKKNFNLNLNNPSLFFNRELSWLQFNSRVLNEASRKDNPLLERLKFLAIYESNMVEFFMIRVSGLKQIEASEVNEIQMDGRTPLETLEEISKVVHQQEANMFKFQKEIFGNLKTQGVEILENFSELQPREKKYISEYFRRDIFRVLTPMAIDPGHPFPHITNNSFYLAVTLQRKGKKAMDHFAILESPSVLERFVELPKNRASKNKTRFIPLEEIIKMHAAELFSGTKVKSIHGFKIIRNSDIVLDEVASENLLSTIENELRNRKWGEAVSLFYRKGMPENIKEFLKHQLDLKDYELYEREGLINLQNLWQVYGSAPDIAGLRDKPFISRNALPMNASKYFFREIRKKNRIFHHPYDSFQTVVELLAYAAQDSKVLAIKQTLYRTGANSPIISSLIAAAENGKQVTVLVELKARFDEETNITWARQMEKHGIHVVYGLVGLKIHSKMLQIIRRESNGVKAYCHLATGNYNPSTAKLYTDLGIFTADPIINNDVTNLFHSLTGYSTYLKFKKIAAAPINLREKLVQLINKEIKNAKSGKNAKLIFKMNSLVDPKMILMLYKASRAGVKVYLNIRGICCLRPNIEGLSENIKVISILGRFLEHSRIFYFENNGNPSIYLSSADIMPRNLNRRVEILFPIEDKDDIDYVSNLLNVTFRDNHNASILLANGNYEKVKPGKSETKFSSQRYFREAAMLEFEKKEKDKQKRRKTIFQPVTNPESDALNIISTDITDE